MEPRTVRIFISSPGDVVEERQKAQQVIADLGRRYAGRLALKPILWEELPLMADMSFQQGIEMILHEQGGIDIAVFILWSRLGSPLGKMLRKPDGSEYRSGTEREWETMLAARAASAQQLSPQEARPKILAYVRNDETGFTQSLQGKTGTVLEDTLRQFSLARQFVREQFHDAQSGTNMGAYTDFSEPVTFAHRLRMHLRNLLDGMLPETGPRVWDRAPYQGLERFEVEHATIYCGREREVCELDERFRARAKAGCPFVLLVGASGSGKSSLARAGWLHYLLCENLDPNVRRWLPVILAPAQAQGDLVGLLVRELADLLPSLRDDEGLGPVIRALRESPQHAWELSIRRAFRDADPQEHTRLVLLVDQFEELFTDPAITPAEVDCFLRAVGVLVRSGDLWCLATVRSDFYDRCLLTPALMELRGSDGQMDLLPPDAGALRRIITHPASFSGLRFEAAASGETLDERILADTVAHPEALPLLEYLLRELYEGRSAEGQLTLQRYESLGGVEGALGRRAETVFSAQGPAQQAAFPELLNALVTIADGEKGVPVRRRAPLDELPEGPCRELARALVEERLLVSDRGEISVAHEALLRRWERSAAWIAENREAILIRARIAQAAARWQAEGRADDFLLPPGKPLAEAVALATTRSRMLSPDLQEYVRLSQDRQVGIERQKRRRLQITATVFAVLGIIAAGAAFFSVTQWRQSGKERDRAEANLYESLFSDARAQMQGRDTGWWWQALHDLREAARLNVPRRDPARLRDLAIACMGTEYPCFRVQATSAQKHRGPVRGVAFSPDARYAVSGGDDGKLRIWSVADGGMVAVLSVATEPVTGVAYHPGGRFVVAASADGMLRLWDLGGDPALVSAPGRPVWTLSLAGGAVTAMACTPDGSLLAAGCQDGTIHLLNATEATLGGKEGPAVGTPDHRVLVGHNGAITCLAFLLDGRQLASTAEDEVIHFWDTALARQINAMPTIHVANRFAFLSDAYLVYSYPAMYGFRYRDLRVQEDDQIVWGVNIHGAPVTALCRGPRGRLLSASADGTLKLWGNFRCATLLAVGRGDFPAALCAAFAPAEAPLVAVGYADGQVRLWEVADSPYRSQVPLGRSQQAMFLSEKRLFNPERLYDFEHGMHAPVQSIQPPTCTALTVHPAGRYFVSATGGTLHVWDLGKQKELLQWPAQANRIDALVCRPDGEQFAAAATDGWIKLWNWEGQPQGTLAVADVGKLHALDWHRDGQHLAVTGERGAFVWDLKKNDGPRLLCRHELPISGLAFGKDTLAVSATDGAINLYALADGAKQRTLPGHNALVSSLAFSSDGRRLAATLADRTVALWDTTTWTATRVLRDSMQIPRYLAFDPSGHYLATSTSGGPALVWDTERGLPLAYIAGRIYCGFTPDGPALLLGTPAGGVWAYTVAEIEQARKSVAGDILGAPPIPAVHLEEVRPSLVPELELDHRTWAMAVSPDGRWFATGTHDHCIHLWDARSVKVVRSMIDHTADDAVWSVAFSHDSRRLASGSAQGNAGEIKVWDVATGQELCGFPAHQGRSPVRSLAFHPQQGWLASAGDDGCVYLWDAPQCRPRGLLHHFPREVWSLAFRPDGQRLAAACRDGTVAIWDTTTLPARPTPPQLTLTGHTGNVTSVAFSADSRYLASGAEQGVIILWNGQTFGYEVTLRGDAGEIRCLSFSSDGGLLAGGAYGLGRYSIVWDLTAVRRTLAEMRIDW
jgi:WD40 repeat protein